MTRIIAGFAGSLSIEVPRSGTRPTIDRVREAIFSSLEARGAIRGARVVDLYAGSGALGLEAVSRGAARVTLVERSGAAAAVCRRNAATVLARSPGGVVVEVVARSVHSFLSSTASSSAGSTAGSTTATTSTAGSTTSTTSTAGSTTVTTSTAGSTTAEWDIAFLDPPYELGENDLARDLELLAPRLADAAVVVVERGSRSPEPTWPASLELERKKPYGDSSLWWAIASRSPRAPVSDARRRSTP